MKHFSVSLVWTLGKYADSGVKKWICIIKTHVQLLLNSIDHFLSQMIFLLHVICQDFLIFPSPKSQK